MKPLVAAVAVLVALAVGAPVQAQTPEIDALRARAEAGDAEAQDDCTSSNQFGPVSLFHKRDFLPVDRPARCA